MILKGNLFVNVERTRDHSTYIQHLVECGKLLEFKDEEATLKRTLQALFEVTSLP